MTGKDIVSKRIIKRLIEDEQSLNEYFFKQGVKEGFKIGDREGYKTMFSSLLKTKFGLIPLKYCAQIVTADSEQLLEWSGNILSAINIDQVFHK